MYNEFLSALTKAFYVYSCGTSYFLCLTINPEFKAQLQEELRLYFDIDDTVSDENLPSIADLFIHNIYETKKISSKAKRIIATDLRNEFIKHIVNKYGYEPVIDNEKYVVGYKAK